MGSLLVENLKAGMQRQKISASELAKRSQVKPSFIYDILNGKSTNPSTTRLAKVAGALNTSLSGLLGIEERRDVVHGNDYVLISRILTVVPAEDNGARIEERQGDPYYFRQSWIQSRLHAQPENLRMVYIEGDGMEPTLCQGDMILIDVTKKKPSPPGVFVLFDGLGLVAKRMEFLPYSNPPAVRILSDNPQYHPYERPLSETDIVGRVVWFAREI